jgi:salicylate hydroxylase
MGSISPPNFHVAIVGGGLCGLSLAIALKNRGISFTVYETRSSFTELGAGINIGPNALKAFSLIDERLGQAIFKNSTRNGPGKENVWFQFRFGAPSGKHKDAELVADIMSPPTGNTSLSRNELLQTLAEMAGFEHARFNKKLSGLAEDGEGVTLSFADGTQERASVVIACDGIHSACRRIILGDDNPAATAKFSYAGAYRGVLPIPRIAAAIGDEMAHTSQLFLGPGAYLIMYPIDGGKNMNVGFWPVRKEPWTESESWIIPNQRKAMEKHAEKWGETAHKILDLMGDPPFFATHHHVLQPDHLYKGRTCLIGDAAHSMPPHQGAGSGQAMEDAYVIAELLNAIDKQNPTREEIDAAFKAYDEVRAPRANRVKDTSQEAMDWWTSFCVEDMTDEHIQDYVRQANERFAWIWNADVEGQGRRARRVMEEVLRR